MAQEVDSAISQAILRGAGRRILAAPVTVGFIALGGVAVEIGIAERGAKLTRADVHAAVVEGALLRIRPETMTKVAIIAGLLPILWSSGTGSEAMQRIAAPMVGGMLSVAILTLVVIPAAYLLWQQKRLGK